MCGIIGILGRGPVAEQLVDALKRLEYRGYDFAGVATLEGDTLERRRAEGKLKNLEKHGCARIRSTGITGIGHTRWATHGKPTESNAHPHATDKRRRRPQRHHREFPRAARRAGKAGRQIHSRDRHRGGGASRQLRAAQGPLAAGSRARRRCRGCAAPSRSPSCSGAMRIC